MRIGHINLAAGFRGGERQTSLLIRELGNKGVEQKLICRRGSPLAEMLADVPGLSIVQLDKPFMLGIGAASGCQLMHAHEAKAAQFALLVRLFLKIPYIITRRVPKVPKNNFFTRAVYRNAERVTALSRAIENNLLSFQHDMPTERIPSMVSSLLVDEDKVAELRKRFAGATVVGHIGALVNYHKGQQYLLEAAQKLRDSHPNVHFVFLGEGKDEAWFKELARDNPNIHFEGFVNNVGDYLQVMNLFAFPSLQEGLGSILLDAMIATRPIVASDVDGIPDLIRHEQNGLLVPPADGNALAAAITRMLDDQVLRTQCAGQAREDAQAYFPAAISERFIELYQSII